jgi:hypothetical protein
VTWWVGKTRRFRLSASSSGDPREAPGVNMARIGPSGGTASELELGVGDAMRCQSSGTELILQLSDGCSLSRRCWWTTLDDAGFPSPT